MSVLNAAARAAITGGNLAHLVTLDPDGAPQVSIVWIGLDGDDIVLGHLVRNRKLQNLERDPRVALSLETGHRNELGLDEYLTVRGTAAIDAGGAPKLLQRLAHVDLGPGVRFPPMDEAPPGRVVRIAPVQVGGVGPWTD